MERLIDSLAGEMQDVDAAMALMASAVARLHGTVEDAEAAAAGQAELPPPVGDGADSAAVEAVRGALDIARTMEHAWHGENGHGMSDLGDLIEDLIGVLENTAPAASAAPRTIVRDEYELALAGQSASESVRHDAQAPTAPARTRVKITGNGHQLTLNL